MVAIMPGERLRRKEIYNDSTYKYYQNGDYVNIGTDISGTEYVLLLVFYTLPRP